MRSKGSLFAVQYIHIILKNSKREVPKCLSCILSTSQLIAILSKKNVILLTKILMNMEGKKTSRFVNIQGKRKSGHHKVVKTSTNSDAGEFERLFEPRYFMKIGERAAANAINENKAMELPFTYMKNGWVVREMPEGDIEQIIKIKEAVKRRRDLKKGTVIHVARKH
jgi:hypothetical protein